MFVLNKTCFALQYKKQAMNIGQKFQTLGGLVLTTLHMNLFASICGIPKFALHITN